VRLSAEGRRGGARCVEKKDGLGRPSFRLLVGS